jgi:APA family basic amino acid/polyamine antiporter
MARKLPGLQPIFSATSLALVGYGEIGSSIFFALGVVAAYALGFTPWVLALVGAILVIVSLSYAEGTAATPEPGGAATFVRRAFNDPTGFATGWVLFLDYVVVIALAALFVPHYLGNALGWEGITDAPWDIVVGIGVMALIAGIRLVRRVRLIPLVVVVAAVTFVVQLVVFALGMTYLFSSDALSQGLDLGVAPTADNFLFALSVAALAYTGIETVANLAAEAREPSRTLPRSLIGGIWLSAVMSVAIAVVGICAYPASPDPQDPSGWSSALGTDWLRAPVYGISVALDASLPDPAADVLRVFVGVTGALVLVGAIITAIAGAGRLAYSLAQRSMLPHAFGRLGTRAAVASPATIAAVTIAAVLLVVADTFEDEVKFLASLYSFGIFIAFTAAQVAVVVLRFTEPDRPRPFRVPLNVRMGPVGVPLPAVLGAILTFGLLIVTLATHDAAQIVGPAWLAAGAVVYVVSRRRGGETLLGHVEAPIGDLLPEEAEGAHQRILVPLKMGEIGEEVLATAIRLALERNASIHVLTVVEVPLSLPLDAELPEQEEAAATSLAEAKEVAEEHEVEIEGRVVRARAIAEAILEEAQGIDADLIIMGSHPRWRKRSPRFFSPTVDLVLRRAPCEVMVVAYPEGVLAGDETG